MLTLPQVYSKWEARADGRHWQRQGGGGGDGGRERGLEGGGGTTLGSIQFGVQKMDGFLPKDPEFMSLGGFLVNRGGKMEACKNEDEEGRDGVY